MALWEAQPAGQTFAAFVRRGTDNFFAGPAPTEDPKAAIKYHQVLKERLKVVKSVEPLNPTAPHSAGHMGAGGAAAPVEGAHLVPGLAMGIGVTVGSSEGDPRDADRPRAYRDQADDAPIEQQQEQQQQQPEVDQVGEGTDEGSDVVSLGYESEGNEEMTEESEEYYEEPAPLKLEGGVHPGVMGLELLGECIVLERGSIMTLPMYMCKPFIRSSCITLEEGYYQMLSYPVRLE